jgi:hypothetical protein
LLVRKHSKYKVQSVVAGVISLLFGMTFSAEVIAVAWTRWYLSKSAREMDVAFSPNALPHVPIAPTAAFAIISVTAFWFRSHMHRKMKMEQENLQTSAHKQEGTA